MRKDFTPQVETREIADSDLDNVSGGVLGLSTGNVIGTVANTEGLVPLSTVTGLVPQVTGLVPAQVTGLVAGL